MQKQTFLCMAAGTCLSAFSAGSGEVHIRWCSERAKVRYYVSPHPLRALQTGFDEKKKKSP